MTFSKLKAFSSLFSSVIKNVNSEKRLSIHLAAVFGCNFTNALYAVSYKILENAFRKSEAKLLNPILQQSFNKMLNIGPVSAQTGPAKRNDKITMQKHIALLKTNKQFHLLSNHVLKYNLRNNLVYYFDSKIHP